MSVLSTNSVPAGAGTTTAPLASFEDAYNFGSGSSILRTFAGLPTSAQDDLMWQATAMIEDRCDRRLAPFTGLVESHRAEGVDHDVLGASDMPMDLHTAIGYSQAIAFANTNLVRDFWLDQWAPKRAEIWAYDVTQIKLLLAYGATYIVPAGAWQGPEADTGFVRLQLGVFCPVGTMVEVTYGGGYSQTPYALKQATILQAFKLAIVGAEPDQRKDMSTTELDAEILSAIAPYIR